MKNLKILLIALSLIHFSHFTSIAQNSKKNVFELNKVEFISKVVDITKPPQEWQYLGDKPAILDFYATWCGPCKILSPRLEKLAEEYAGQIYVYKVDVDKEKELAAAFNITAMPTLFFFPIKGDGQYVQGLVSKKDLKKVIDEFLLKE